MVTLGMDIAFLPKTVLSFISGDHRAQIHWNIVLSQSLVVLTAVLLAHPFFESPRIPRVCLSQELVGLPCPGCGITRGILAVFSGDFATAYHANPVSILIVTVLFVQIAMHAAALMKKTASGTVLRLSGRLTGLVVVALLAHWLRILTIND